MRNWFLLDYAGAQTKPCVWTSAKHEEPAHDKRAEELKEGEKQYSGTSVSIELTNYW